MLENRLIIEILKQIMEESNGNERYNRTLLFRS